MIEIEKPVISFRNYDEDKNYLELSLEPLERGFGITLGNSLRRIMLSSLPGCAVKWIKCNDALHEMSTIDGVKEDLVDIVLNIKNLVANIDGDDEEKILRIEKDKEGIITAGDIIADSQVEIINPDLKIATLTQNKPFYLEMGLVRGRGYVSAEENKKSLDETVGKIAIDSIFTPVIKSNFYVEPTRVGDATDYDRLIQQIWTNGSITPEDAVGLAAKVLNDLLSLFIDLTDEMHGVNILVEKEDEPKTKALELTVEELDFSMRSRNGLKRAGINTIEELVSKTEEDLLKVKNIGKISLKEIIEKLEDFDLKLSDEQE